MSMRLRGLDVRVNIADVLAKLVALQNELDAAGFPLAAIYLEHAIDEIVATLGKVPDDPACNDRTEPN